MVDVVSRAEIAPASALALVERVVAYAHAKDWQVCAAVCDARGYLVAFLRTEAVGDASIEFAIDKAYTAALLRRTTRAFAERALERPPLRMGLANRSRLLVFPGGLPLFVSRVCIGGIGVSGAADEEDEECARAAIAALGLDAV